MPLLPSAPSLAGGIARAKPTGVFAPSIGFDWQESEVKFAALPAQSMGAIKLGLPVSNVHRQIYSACWTTQANANDYFMILELAFLYNNAVVGKLPISFGISPAGGGGTMPRTLVSVSTSGNQSGFNTVLVSLANDPNVAQKQWMVNPFDISVQADEARINVLQSANITTAHIWLGIISNSL